MQTLAHTSASLSSKCSTSGRKSASFAPPSRPCSGRRLLSVRAHKVELELNGTRHVLEVDEDTTIFQAAIDAGLEADVPHDCRMGVCLACASRISSGEVDQTGGMISDDAADKGYALLCVAYPQSDVDVRIIPQEELMDEVMMTAKA